ncbi:MAG TPA: hypothetical protein VFN10_10835 [Thermoanaerobaculia bacterium]|nr:hypothetical protein [Thermoanaerobaculia bacterium]
MRTRLAMLMILALALPAFAAGKRRAVAAPSTPPQTGGGDCVNFAPVRTGLKASYSAPGGVTFTITYLSDSATQTRTTQHVVTPQATADAETRLDWEQIPNASITYRAMKHLYTKVTTPVPFLGNQVIETDIDFVPSYITGPATGYCVGTKWHTPTSNETIMVKSIAGTQVQTGTAIAFDGEVLAVETITVPGGQFKTVKVKGATVTDSGVQRSIQWLSPDYSISIKQETYDDAGNLTGTTVLTKLEL